MEFSARRLAKETGLTSSQLTVLRILRQGELTPSAIATQIGLTQATVTTLIDRLVERGLVQRRRGESDRRHIWIDLTAEGHAMIESMPPDLQVSFQNEFDRMQDWEQAMVVASLERMAGLLNADRIDAGPVLEFGEIGTPRP
ncbi:MarR family transcriptional regulator [Aurantimonas sp. A2-1-M11]|uniref:MarR family winged helix-turn-helix transcriptional regulator n=1 Tax=Aurantimonas sp. A2-1-M11 TaxID=3113712 RepID=UPI002F952388